MNLLFYLVEDNMLMSTDALTKETKCSSKPWNYEILIYHGEKYGNLPKPMEP